MDSLASTFYGFPLRKDQIYFKDKVTQKEVDWEEVWEEVTNKPPWKNCKVSINIPTENKEATVYYLYHIESSTLTNNYQMVQIKIPSNNNLIRWEKDIKEFCETLSIKYVSPTWYFVANTL